MPPRKRPLPKAPSAPIGLRIIGGRFRGRRLEYSGDLRTRPMKDRLREAVFNLVGTQVNGKHAIDLFAGTGALGLEALSRGAARATFIEQHFPTADILQKNAATLGVEDRTQIHRANTFLWWRRHDDLGPLPWLVFCSPPYAFYLDRAAEMHALLAGMWAAAPAESIFVAEFDTRFDAAQLPASADWSIRAYPPAVVAIAAKRGGELNPTGGLPNQATAPTERG